MSSFERLSSVQKLVTDFSKVNRNHYVPGTERHETSLEHSFASIILAWEVASSLSLDLDLEKVFKYILVHDFTERGLKKDFNAYRHASDHDKKRAYEEAELQRIVEEYGWFDDLTNTLIAYQTKEDNEAWFADSIEKMQAIILDERDSWRAHQSIGATYQDYVEHHQRVLEDCYPDISELMAEVIETGRQRYYDQPK